MKQNKQEIKTLDQILNEQFMLTNEDKDGSYLYILTRVKEAFAYGTVTLKDFVEITLYDEWVIETKDKVQKAHKEELRKAIDEAFSEGYIIREDANNLMEGITQSEDKRKELYKQFNCEE